MTLNEVRSTRWNAWVASLVGRAHERGGRGPQDAWAVMTDGATQVGVVADGCSAGARSEVGAGVGARYAAAACARRARAAQLMDVPALVVADVVEELRRLACVCAISNEDAVQFVEQHLLFTLVMAIAREDEAIVFGVGDGVVCVDGEVAVVDQGDAPDYPAYALFPTMTPPRVWVHHVGAAACVAIATDGAKELATLSALIAEPLAANASLLQKRLRASGERPWDDCTMIVLRRSTPCA